MIGLSTPAYAIFLVLLIGGFFRSLQFTSLTTLAYADLPDSRISAATSFSSMMQQVMNGMGVALAAVLLHVAQLARGEALGGVSIVDIRAVFVTMALLALSACVFYLRLSPDAGAEVSGHRRVTVAAEGTAD